MPTLDRSLHMIWDFDGTLYDTYPCMTKALQAALAGFGVAEPYSETFAMIKQTLFYGVSTLATRHGLPPDTLMAAYRVAYQRYREFPPMPRLAECLQMTAALGARHYLFTHRDRSAVRQLETDGLALLFSDFVTREDGFTDKPSPAAILYLMGKHRFSAKAALMIGDRDIDILAGEAAGVRGVLLDPDGCYPTVISTYRVSALHEVAMLAQNLLASNSGKP